MAYIHNRLNQFCGRHCVHHSTRTICIYWMAPLETDVHTLLSFLRQNKNFRRCQLKKNSDPVWKKCGSYFFSPSHLCPSLLNITLWSSMHSVALWTYLKTFRPSGSPIILVIWPLAPAPNSKGNPFGWGVKYTGVGKIGDFWRKSPFISGKVQDRPIVTMER